MAGLNAPARLPLGGFRRVVRGVEARLRGVDRADIAERPALDAA